METQWKIIGETGLQFFGKMSASISHELNNFLAIINENAGLMEDISLMEARGVPIDGGRIATLAGRIKTQVQRAERTIKNMNRFAHTADESLGSVDVSDLLFLMEALSERLAAMRGVTLKPVVPTEKFVIAGNLFLLEHLIWRCLDFAMDVAGAEKMVVITAEKTEQEAIIHFTGLDGLAGKERRTFPSEKEDALLLALEARLDVNTGHGKVCITLPLDAGL